MGGVGRGPGGCIAIPVRSSLSVLRHQRLSAIAIHCLFLTFKCYTLQRDESDSIVDQWFALLPELKSIGLRAKLKCPIGVSVNVSVYLTSLDWDRLVSCPGCSSRLPQRVLGWAPAPRDQKKKQFREWVNGCRGEG